ncbi:tail fiber protein [Paenibacillus sp. SC116]|uniref:phage tail protein n=1 Tax=Paenibacillus sp. SC116 TaxID=2968986 RepID=UPI00215B0B69|nr:tail fiber protein [Paenibacillus sp. SC116]MCR8846361.1 tail fiber protein [Paenibacillus sp. SC116]
MSEPYLGEIRMFAGNYAPTGWALCNGQLLSIAENEALFILVGNTYGGDGQTTFGLPNLQSRIPIHRSTKYPLGNLGGTETVTLTTGQLPAHTHLALSVETTGNTASPVNALWAGAPTTNFGQGQQGTLVPMNAQSITPTGGSQPHDNMMPSMTISFIIAIYGVFPSSQ